MRWLFLVFGFGVLAGSVCFFVGVTMVRGEGLRSCYFR